MFNVSSIYGINIEIPEMLVFNLVSGQRPRIKAQDREWNERSEFFELNRMLVSRNNMSDVRGSPICKTF